MRGMTLNKDGTDYGMQVVRTDVRVICQQCQVSFGECCRGAGRLQGKHQHEDNSDLLLWSDLAPNGYLA
jgi:hypothetical protein